MNDNFLAAFSAFGIEIEYMIVDRTTLDIAPVSDRLLTVAAGELTSETQQGEISWSNELVLHVVELKTNGPKPRLAPVVADFQASVQRINGLLETWNACLLPGGAHPWMNPVHDTRLWPHDVDAIYAAYDRIFGCQGHGWSNLQSVHINLPFKNDGEFGPLHAAVRVILPLLPALAASSPVLEGGLTGLLDARVDAYAKNQSRLPPITGRIVPEAVRNFAEYQQRILEPMYRAIAPHDPESILQYEWLNSHGAIARFDRQTIEIRLLDTQEYPGADLAIAALVVAVVKRLYHGAAATLSAADALDTGMLATLLRRCVEYGENARIDSAQYLRVLGISGVTQTAGTVWRKLAKLAADELRAHQGPLDVILEQGTLATRLLRSIGTPCDHDRLTATYSRLRRCLATGEMFTADA